MDIKRFSTQTSIVCDEAITAITGAFEMFKEATLGSNQTAAAMPDQKGVSALCRVNNKETLDWKRLGQTKDDADSLAWITSEFFSRLVKVGKDSAEVMHVFATLSDHEKIPDSLIETLKTCQQLPVIYKSLRTLRDIFNSYREHVKVLDSDFRAVRGKYHGLRISIRNLAGGYRAEQLMSEHVCSLGLSVSGPSHHKDSIKIAETLATLNLLAVRTSIVLQEIIDMHGKCHL